MSEYSFSPDFIGIGTAKSGTTWLYECLREHPEVCMSPVKEVDFFNRHQVFWRPDLTGLSNYDKGTAWYADHFSTCPAGSVRGEISPIYFFSPEVPELMHGLAPEAKLFLALRNPVDRLYSHYLYTKEKGMYPVPETFEEAVEKYPSFADEGNYFKFLNNYLRYFPKERILVLIFEEMRRDPEVTIKTLYRHIGVNEAFVPPSLHASVNERTDRATELKLARLKRRFSSSTVAPLLAAGEKVPGLKSAFKRAFATATRPPKDTVGVPPKLRKRLFAAYRNDIADLETYLGRTLEFWR